MIKQIGKYQVEAELGQGGFGRVYKAYDPLVGRPVAVKILTAQGEPDMLTRFQNEAAAAGNLRHPNIITVYDFGQHNGIPYIVMEFVEGDDLQKILASHRPLSILEKMKIMAQVAAGLQCAHRSGVVHRDVKPANIMLMSDGSVKLMDFGIALLTRSGAARLTQKGNIIGTVSYMSPEHFLGREVGPLADIFSFGTIYYELLTGQHPFAAADPPQVMYNITTREPVSLRSLVPDLPEALAEVIRHTLAKEEELRYQSLEDVMLDTEPIMRELQKDRAASLLIEARDLLSRRTFEQAHSVVRSILELDPGNAEARQLREAVQQHMQKRALKPRIEALVRTAEEDLAKRQYTQALQNFESALRLDSTDTTLKMKIEHVRAQMEQSRKAAALLNDARQVMGRQDLTGAFRLAREASRFDPKNPEIAALLASVQREIELRERECRLQEGITRVNGLILIQSFDEALRVLSALEESCGSDPAIAQARERVGGLQREQERMRQLREQIDGAKRLLMDRKLEEAVRRLQELRIAFTDHEEVRQLLDYARDEWAAQQRSEAVGAMVREAQTAAETKDFARAVQVLQRGLEMYPGDATLGRMLESTLSSRAAVERQTAIARVVDSVSGLKRDGRNQEALAAVQAALREYGDEGSLASLRRELEIEIERAAREQAIREAVQQVDSLIAQGRPLDAMNRVRDALRFYSGESEIVGAMSRASQALQEHERREYIKQQIALAGQMEARQDWRGALQLLDSARMRYPDASELSAISDRIRTAQRATEVQERVRRAQQLEQDRRYSEALQVIETAEREFGADESFAAARSQIAQQLDRNRREEAIRGRVAQAAKLIEQSRPHEAVNLLRDSITKAGNAPELVSALSAAERAVEAFEKRQFVKQHLEKALEIERRGDIAGASKVIDAALALHPDAADLHPVAERLKQILRDSERAAARQRIEEFRKQGDLDKALQTATFVVSQFSNDLALTDLQKELAREVDAREQEKRRAAELEAQRIAEEQARHAAQEQARRRAEEEARIKAQEEARRRAEEEARQAAEQARLRAEEERRQFEIQARQRAEEEARCKAELAEAEARKRAEEEKRAFEAEARRKAEEDARRLAEQERLRLAEERRLFDEEARRKAELAQAEARKLAEQEKRRLDEQRRLAEEENKRIQAEKLRFEEERRAAEKARAEEEKHLAAEKKRLAEERKQAEAARRRTEEDQKRLEEEKRRLANAQSKKAAAAAAAGAGAIPIPPPPNKLNLPVVGGSAAVIIGIIVAGVYFSNRAGQPTPQPQPPPPQIHTSPQPQPPAAAVVPPEPSPVTPDPAPAPVSAATATGEAASTLLSISRNSLAFTYKQGGSPPPSQSLKIASGARSAPYRVVTNGAAWAKVSPVNGSTPGAIDIRVDPTGLPAGTHSGAVLLASGNAPGQRIPITLTVEPTATAPVTASPKPVEPVKQEPPVKALSDYGLDSGRVRWTGSLPENGVLILDRSGVRQGGGNTTNHVQLPVNDALAIVDVVPKVESTVSNRNQIVIKNTSGGVLSFVEIRWKRQQ